MNQATTICNTCNINRIQDLALKTEERWKFRGQQMHGRWKWKCQCSHTDYPFLRVEETTSVPSGLVTERQMHDKRWQKGIVLENALELRNCSSDVYVWDKEPTHVSTFWIFKIEGHSSFSHSDPKLTGIIQ